MTAETSGVRLRTVALPAEHGGWGFLFEPLFLGILVAPGTVGACFVVATAAAFLLRHPVKLILHDRHRAQPSARVPLARRVAAFYACAGLAGLLLGVWIGGWVPILPFVLVSPLGLTYLVYEGRSQGRSLVAELAAPCALAAAAPAIVLAAGWPPAHAAAIWILLVARAVPTILYVRARLRLERGRPSSAVPIAVCHVIALLVGAALAWFGLGPWLAAAALLVLGVRAAQGLSRHRRPAAPKRVGLMEMAWGSAFVVSTVLGYWLGI